MYKRETVVVIVLVSYCGVPFFSNSLFNNILSDLDSGGFVK